MCVIGPVKKARRPDKSSVANVMLIQKQTLACVQELVHIQQQMLQVKKDKLELQREMVMMKKVEMARNGMVLGEDGVWQVVVSPTEE